MSDPAAVFRGTAAGRSVRKAVHGKPNMYTTYHPDVAAVYSANREAISAAEAAAPPPPPHPASMKSRMKVSVPYSTGMPGTVSDTFEHRRGRYIPARKSESTIAAQRQAEPAAEPQPPKGPLLDAHEKARLAQIFEFGEELPAGAEVVAPQRPVKAPELSLEEEFEKTVQEIEERRAFLMCKLDRQRAKELEPVIKREIADKTGLLKKLQLQIDGPPSRA